MISVQIDSVTGSEIVPTSEFKSYARIETSDDDTVIAEMIKAARKKCEAFINRDIVAKTRSLFIGNLKPSGEYGDLYRKKAKIVLPFAPITAITSVQTQASDGTLTSITYDSYGLEDKYLEVASSYNKNIKIVYTTTGLSNDDLKIAIKQLAATYYDNRSDFVQGNINTIPTNAQSMLDPYVYFNEV